MRPPPSETVHTTCHALADMEKYRVADQRPTPPSCKNAVTYIQAEELPSPKMSADNYAVASNAPGQHDPGDLTSEEPNHPPAVPGKALGERVV